MNLADAPCSQLPKKENIPGFWHLLAKAFNMRPEIFLSDFELLFQCVFAGRFVNRQFFKVMRKFLSAGAQKGESLTLLAQCNCPLNQ